MRWACWPMAKRGAVPNAGETRVRSAGKLLPVLAAQLGAGWSSAGPDWSTYWRSSSQMGQRGGRLGCRRELGPAGDADVMIHRFPMVNAQSPTKPPALGRTLTAEFGDDDIGRERFSL